MISRRKFISNIAIGGIAISALPNAVFAFTGDNKLNRIGYIAGMIKNELQEGDWKTILKKTADLGYTEYEGGILGDSPKEFLNYCKSIGQKPIAGGITFSKDMDEVQISMDKLNEAGMEYAISYWPWLVGGPFKLDDCKISVDILNQIGELAKKNGLKFCWHNHDKEFLEMEEGKPFDYLMKHTEKELVSCEMDIYWVKKGGADPVKVLREYEGRIPILHVKDMADDADKSIICPGKGNIDFPSIFAEANKQGIKHYFVERDNIVDGLGCLKSSMEYLEALRF
ncbi:MAG: sugar phosphate isomerase/epimerase [Melioribacteraceae bacterium]|nr:sugar phosphate isomerase/epimerase [Melioribacteraceae bacterium]